MKAVVFGILIVLTGFQAKAAIYDCKITVGTTPGFSHSVDTSTNLQYIWLFRAYKNVRSWCGTSFHSSKLTCQHKASSEGATKIYATAEIEIGDRSLSVFTPDCGHDVPCSIECRLNTDER